jgi:hypothetical protein
VHLIDVLDVELGSFEGARLGVDIACSEGDRTRGTGRHQLHETVLLVDVHVLLDAKANLFDVNAYAPSTSATGTETNSRRISIAIPPVRP